MIFDMIYIAGLTYLVYGDQIEEIWADLCEIWAEK